MLHHPHRLCLKFCKKAFKIIDIEQINDLAVPGLVLQNLHADPTPDLPVRQIKVVADSFGVELAKTELFFLGLLRLLLLYNLF